MKVKKLCSLGRLDININMVFNKAQAKQLNFNIDSYNKVEDLKELFQNIGDKNKYNHNSESSIDYMDYITLTSDNYLINTLLYINRASKVKTFIEFIMPNQVEYDDNKKFLKTLIDNVLAKNYFFIVENSIMDCPSKIIFKIKIINDNNNEVIACKCFELFEKNEMDIEPVEEYNIEKSMENIFIDKINYNFNKTNYFIIDLKEIKAILIDFQNIYNFLLNIVENYPNILIIFIIDDNINVQDNNDLFIIKKLIELCDVIFTFKNNMNNFLKSFYSVKKRDIFEKSPSKIYFMTKNDDNLNRLDLITKDFEKYRRDIPRLSIIFEEFNLIHIYKQDFLNKCVSYEDIFPLLFDKGDENKKNFIYSNSNKLYHIFIGGFLSRFIYNKSFDICLKAGKLIMIKTIDIFISKKDFYTNQEKYNIEVKFKNMHLINKIKNIISKERHFILDCTNKVKSEKKEYNILSDNNCLGYLTKKYYSKDNKKLTLMEKINILLKKNKNKNNIKNKTSDNFYKMGINKGKINAIIKNEDYIYSKKKIKRLLPFITINDVVNYTNSNKEKTTPNYNYKKSKTISYYPKSNNKSIKQDIRYKHSAYTTEKHKNNMNKNRIIKNIMKNIHKTENYSKYLFKLYQPKKNFDNFISEYNNLQSLKLNKNI